MTVSNNFRIDVRPYAGYDDPSLPVASWIAQAGSVGDASGGTVRQNFFVQLDTDPHISELYNLEQISADTSTSVDREAILETQNMDQLAPNRDASPRLWRFRTFDAAGINGFSSMQLDTNNLLPIWLGAPNRGEGDKGLRVVWTNVDLLLYAVTLQGYIWGPRSVMAPGGPQRPVGGLFGG